MFIQEIGLRRLCPADAHTFTVASIYCDGEQMVSVKGFGANNCDVRVVSACQCHLAASALHSRVYYSPIGIL